MNSTRLFFHGVFAIAITIGCSTIASAQTGAGNAGAGNAGTGNTGTGNTGTGNTGTGNTGTGAIGTGTEIGPDTSVFDTLQRGTGIGTAGTTGFGPGALQNGGGAAGFGGGGGGLGGLFGGGGGGLGGIFGGNFGGGGQANTPTIRTRLRSAIQVAPIPAQQVQFNANQRIVQLPQRQGMQNVQVNMVGRTAVIQGTAASDRDRRMAELLMRLEPGVSQVQNNVTIQQ